MKKFLMLMFLALLSLPILAQVVEPPANWLDLFANINVWLGSLTGVAAVTVFIAAAANTLLKTTGIWKQIVAMVVSIILLGVGNLVNMGFMAELNLLHTIIYGLAGGLLANGIFDLGFLNVLLRLLKVIPAEEK